MVKGISAVNSTVRKFVFGAAIAGTAMLLGASSPIKNTRAEREPQRTELMSKESAEALRVNSLQQTPTIPTVHNKKLDATYLKFAEDQEDINFVNNKCNNMYTNLGTYLGSVIIQKEIDSQMLIALLKKNTNVVIKNNINPQLGRRIESFGEPFYATITPNADIIKQWIYKYNSTINSNLQFDHKPTAEEVSDRLDFIAENKCSFTKEEIIHYKVCCNDFLHNHIKDKKGTQAVSDLLAYKMFMIDKLNFAKELYGTGVFGRGSYENGYNTMRDYYNEWMESVEPKAD